MTTATQIADWLVKYRADDAGAPIDAMSLEKHLFYAQGFFLATEHEPLFLDEIEAWRDGPVVPAVYQRYKKHGAQLIEQAAQAPPAFETKKEEFLFDVVRFLRSHTALALSDATHAEDPWMNARKPFKRGDYSSVPLSRDTLHTYFATLIDEGEDALSAHALLDTLPEPRWGWSYVAGVCARRMTKHPFYLYGIGLWKEKLWEAPASPPSVPRDCFKPPKKEQSKTATFSTVEEYRKIRAAERLAAAE
jgi:uncharacterized phage-associated protein